MDLRRGTRRRCPSKSDLYSFNHTVAILSTFEKNFRYTTLTIVFKVKRDLRSKNVFLRYSLATLHVEQLITNSSSTHPQLVGNGFNLKSFKVNIKSKLKRQIIDYIQVHTYMHLYRHYKI